MLVTGNQHLCQPASLTPITKGGYQVKRANNSFIDTEGCSTSSFYIERQGAKPVKIALQNISYIPAYRTNYLFILLYLIRMRVMSILASRIEPRQLLGPNS